MWSDVSYAVDLSTACEFESGATLEAFQKIHDGDTQIRHDYLVLRACGFTEQDRRGPNWWIKLVDERVVPAGWAFMFNDQARTFFAGWSKRFAESLRHSIHLRDRNPWLTEFQSFTNWLHRSGPYDQVRFFHAAIAFNGWDWPKTFELETEREMTLAAIALARKNLADGDYPHRLEELVPGYLDRLAMDWMNGMPLRYRRVGTGSYLLYSVGQDGIDNHGDSTPPDPNDRASLWRGRDAVWPRLATDHEFDAWKEQQRVREEKLFK
jgi:hypothetical protein